MHDGQNHMLLRPPAVSLTHPFMRREAQPQCGQLQSKLTCPLPTMLAQSSPSAYSVANRKSVFGFTYTR
eukprot:2542837-Amphidinium_carterae.1